MNDLNEWSGSPDPRDPSNYWVDDVTNERVNAWTGERTVLSMSDIREINQLVAEDE